MVRSLGHSLRSAWWLGRALLRSQVLRRRELRRSPDDRRSLVITVTNTGSLTVRRCDDDEYAAWKARPGDDDPSVKWQAGWDRWDR